ncbi:hypothetical protein [Microbacterium schleiferi]|uniref:hypothetical protein n=1 Tax=Microbacterium schleiferi TaxID=69362 RepID=UPI001D1799A3|nr:hypothetical protein [Microbacterium schleiferi]MCC4268390.1 hypothetical protein [Microbacterium schleiferi]
MEAAGFVGILIIIGIAVVAAIIIALIGLLLAKAWIKVARADEALVISGRKQRVQTTVMDADGTSRSEMSESPVTVIVNGKSLVNPITQRHEIISLRSRQVSLNAEAQSLDNVTLNVDGVCDRQDRVRPGVRPPCRRAFRVTGQGDRTVHHGAA